MLEICTLLNFLPLRNDQSIFDKEFNPSLKKTKKPNKKKTKKTKQKRFFFSNDSTKDSVWKKKKSIQPILETELKGMNIKIFSHKSQAIKFVNYLVKRMLIFIG